MNFEIIFSLGLKSGVIWALMIIGVYITYRILDIADLGVEGTFPLGAAIRVKNFVEYQNDEQFTREVTKYVQEAAKQVLFYRKLQDIATAKSYVKKWLRKYNGNPRIDELNTINHLHDEEVLQIIKQTRAFWRSKPSMKKMKNYDVFDDCSQKGR